MNRGERYAHDKQKQSESERRRRYAQRWTELKSARTTWLEHWRELAENFWPRGARFLVTDANRGDKVNSHVINGRPIRARRTLSAGMSSAVMPPSRQWFSLQVDDAELSEREAVKTFLAKVAEALNAALLRSNFYKEAPKLFDDLVTFGTSCQFIDEDATDTVRFYALPIGSYCLVSDARERVSAVFHESSMTVEQLVEKFGLEACSTQTQTLYKSAKYDMPVTVMHVVEPNRAYNKKATVGHATKRWTSVWYETSAGDDCGFLRESGYFEQPFIAPRWRVTSGDVYGWSPAMDALGDAKELQLVELRKTEMLALIAKQPTQGPSDVEAHVVSLLPGGYTAVPSMAAGSKVTPIMDVVALARAKADLTTEGQALETRVDEIMFVDMWLMMQQRMKGDRTAREVDELRDEKMLQLGPVNDNLKDDAQDPLIARLLGVCARAGKLPPVPEEMQGREFTVRYESPMAQAQRMQATVGMQRLAGTVLSILPVVPSVADKFDFDQYIDEEAKALGTPGSIVRTDDVVESMRQQRQQAQQQAQQLAAAQQTAETAKTLGETPIGGGDQTALDALLRTRGAA